jgi:hypothetical protein
VFHRCTICAQVLELVVVVQQERRAQAHQASGETAVGWQALAALADRIAEREPTVALALALRAGHEVTLDDRAVCRRERPGC